MLARIIESFFLSLVSECKVYPLRNIIRTARATPRRDVTLEESTLTSGELFRVVRSYSNFVLQQ